MKAIKELVDMIDEELCGAKLYAEKYVELKVAGSDWSAKFKSLAEDELRHADYIHQYATEKITELENVYVAPQNMKDIWKHEHKKYVENAAWIRTMLQM